MSDTEHRKLRESITELRPNAIWFLLTLIGSVIVVEIVGWIPDPIAKAIVIGIGLCLNAFLIAWLSWLRTQDNKANLRELTILLERIEKMQKAALNVRRKRQQQEQPPQPISSLESKHPETADLPSRTEFHDRPTSPRWGIAEQHARSDVGEQESRWAIGEHDAYKQWARLNSAEKAIVRFVLLRGTATAAQLLQFRNPEGFRSTDVCAGVKEKTSFLSGDLESGLTINPQLKPYLDQIIVQDKSRGAHF